MVEDLLENDVQVNRLHSSTLSDFGAFTFAARRVKSQDIAYT
jgi:hypothetical protein